MLILNNYNDKEIHKLQLKANTILALNHKMSNLSDYDLSNMTFKFKERLKNGETLDDLLIEAFAVCREASFRILGKKQYKVQIIGGLAIHQGRVVEMKTGEGKTLTELCPAYLNSLSSKGVHVITVNDYLSKRDKEEMEPLFNFLNISVGLVISSTLERKLEYKKDITYTTNTELGFDYLRDNIVKEPIDKVLRNLNFVIIDEIDSILIDEARTPLIISGTGADATDIYKYSNYIVSHLKPEHYKIDRKDNTILLTENGVNKIESMLEISNLSKVCFSELNHALNQALRATHLMSINKDYIINDNEIVIIDESTGRIAEGRRFSDGLHQCLEAKEMLPINAESETLATITYQNFFRLYPKISGMSGTVKTEEKEFKEIYNLDVVVIPTHKPIKRIDYLDLVYTTKGLKLAAIIKDIIKIHETGRPILVGTSSIKESESLSKKLHLLNIKHNLLNAKNKEEEASIISKAGEFNAITIATNIAGRGTDIKISDDVNYMGGLKVIATERSESKRIDNQLLGRAGRQGNYGSSQFYVSLEDELLVVNSKKSFDRNSLIKHIDKVRKEIFKCQERVSYKDYEIRKDTIKFNEIINTYRKTVYVERDCILYGIDITKNITRMLVEINTNIVSTIFKEFNIISLQDIDASTKPLFFNKLISEFDLHYKYSFFESYDLHKFNNISTQSQLVEFCTDELINYFNKLLMSEVIDFNLHVRQAFLECIDNNWIGYLNDMQLLRNRVKTQVYMQKDPLQVYNKEGALLYADLIDSIRSDFVKKLFIELIPYLIFKFENYKNN